MQTISIIVATLLNVAFSGNSPDYDYTYIPSGNGERGECEFRGYISNTGSNLCQTKEIYRYDFTQGVDLTWEILTSACPELIQGGCADPDWEDGPDHNMTTDLEWPNSCNYGTTSGCPRCPCNNGQPDTYYLNNYTTIDTSSGFQVVDCLVCECDYFRQYEDEQGNDIDVYALDCTGSGGDQRTFNSPNELQDIQCPYTTPEPTPQPTGGCDDGAGNTHNPGDYFFYYDGNECDTYCLCNSTSGLDCEQGWDNITARDEMKYELLDDCSGYLEDAFNDTSRWAKQTGNCDPDEFYFSKSLTAFYQCPINTCGSYNDGESWNATSWAGDYEDGMVEELYNCELCTCDSDSSGDSSTDTVQCSTIGTSVTDLDQCKDLSKTIECSYDYNGNGEIDDTTTTFFGNQVLRDKESCSVSGVAGSSEYCGWTKEDTPKGTDPDTVCIKDELPSNEIDWGCRTDYECIAAFGYEALNESETGFCSYNEVSFTAKEFDCIDFVWKSETYTINYNLMCCGTAAGDLCNNQIPSQTALGDDNKCEGKGSINEYLKSQYECEYGDKGVTNIDYIKELKCGVSLPETDNVEGRVCDLIANRWKWETTCACKQYQALEKAFGNSDYEDTLRDNLQDSFDTSYSSLMVTLEEWNEYYECGKTFECDIYDSSVNTIKMSFLSVIFIIFINYCL